MSTTVTPPPPAPAVAAPKVDAPPAPAVIAAPVEPTPAVAPTDADLSKLSVKELTDLQRTADTRNRAPKSATVVEKKPAAPAPDAKPADASPKTEEPKPGDKAADEAAGGQKPPQYRLRGRDAKEDAFLALVSAGRSVPEATAIVYPTEAKPAEPKPGEPSPAEDAGVTEQITRIDGEIKTANTELEKLYADADKAAAESDLEGVNRINREINRKERAVDRLNSLKENHESERARIAQQANIRREKADHDQVVKNYPELGDKNSAEYGKFMTFFRAKEAIANANPRSEEAAILALPNWRSLFVREFAEQEGLVPAHRRTASPAAAPAPEITAPPPKVERQQASAAKVLTTTDQPEGQTFELTAADVEKQLENLTPKQLGELQRNADRARREQNRRPAA